MNYGINRLVQWAVWLKNTMRMVAIGIALLTLFLPMGHAAQAQPDQGCGPGGSVSPPAHKQDGSEWCWAATSQMIMEKWGTSKAQWFIVDVVRRNVWGDKGPPPTCFGHEFDPRCDKSGDPKDVFDLFNFHFNLQQGTKPLDWKKITGQISNDHPFIIGAQYSSGSAHGYVVKRYFTETDGTCHIGWYNPDIFKVDYEELAYEELSGTDYSYFWNYINIEPK